jgi:hypothetical protein
MECVGAAQFAIGQYYLHYKCVYTYVETSVSIQNVSRFCFQRTSVYLNFRLALLPFSVPCIISGASAQIGPWPPLGFHDSYSTMWVISSMIDLVLHNLIQPSETSSSNY